MELYRITVPKDDAYRIIERMGDIAKFHFIDLNKQEQPFNLPYGARIKAADDCERRLALLFKLCKESRVRVIHPQDIEDYKKRVDIIAGQKRMALNLLFDAFDNDIKEIEKFVVNERKMISEMKTNINTMKDRLEVLQFVYQQSHAIIQNAVVSPEQTAMMHLRQLTLDNLVDQKEYDSRGENQAKKAAIESKRKRSRSLSLQHQDIEAVNIADYIEHRGEEVVDGGVTIDFVAGTMCTSLKERLTRLLFRTTRGKALVLYHDFEYPCTTVGLIKRSVFMVVYQDGSMIHDRIQKICDSFDAERFEVPPLREIQKECENETLKIEAANVLLETTEKQLVNYLMCINRGPKLEGDLKGKQPSMLALQSYYMAKEKAICTALNMLKSRDKADVTYTGFFWIPVEMEEPIKISLQEFPEVCFNAWRQNKEDPMLYTPPTYFKMNDVIEIPQLITNTYGIPSYGEANPAVFTIVTFPFLFAVMFGDYGHGSLILLLGTIFVLFDKQLKKTSLKSVLPFRYFIWMMGFFSCYIGLLYNEFFAIPYDWFGTCYDTTIDRSEKHRENHFFLKKGTELGSYATEDAYDCVYPVGIDPTWYLAENEILTVQNSVKMKMAVILGVAHMMMGIFVKGFNTINNKETLIFFTEVVTGVFILFALFGWMDYLIFAKWFFPYYAYNFMIKEEIAHSPEAPTLEVCQMYEKQYNDLANTPSIYTIMINNFLSGGDQFGTYSYDVPAKCAAANYTYYVADVVNFSAPYQVFLFDYQLEVSEALVLLVLFCVPIYLCVKPCCFVCHRKKHVEKIKILPLPGHSTIDQKGDSDLSPQHSMKIQEAIIEGGNKFEMLPNLNPSILHLEKSDLTADNKLQHTAFDNGLSDDSINQIKDEDQTTSSALDENYFKDKSVWEKVLNAEYELDQVHSHGVGEAFIHQMIECIEFVLGCVSNTASYLRLWALSLAHSQLAIVFLEYILPQPWALCDYGHCGIAEITIGSFLSWFVFMSATFSILMCMDVLECCLHTLRLHWVEFQSKFYKGAGYLYNPFSFDAVFARSVKL